MPEELSITTDVKYKLRLYVNDNAPTSVAAVTNLTRICEEHVKGEYKIDIIDVVKDPQIAKNEDILAIPTLERKDTLSRIRIVGDLSNTERVLSRLGMYP